MFSRSAAETWATDSASSGFWLEDLLFTATVTPIPAMIATPVEINMTGRAFDFFSFFSEGSDDEYEFLSSSPSPPSFPLDEGVSYPPPA